MPLACAWAVRCWLRYAKASWWTTEQQGNLTVSNSLFRQVIVYDQRIFTAVTEVFAHCATGVWRQVLQCSRFRSGRNNNNGVSQCAVLFQFTNHVRNGGRFLAAEIEKVFEFFEALAEERGLKLSLAGRAGLVSGDPLMLRRALSNLLSNALRYTPREHTITVSLRDVEGGVEIVVANPGTPIAPAHLSRLFDRFYRVDPSRQRKDESSSGIGLAIVKSIITAHAGKVAVESDRHSTRFIITLPTALT
jgi:signal transduction histidine kinase